MKLLFIGDIFASVGRRVVAELLPEVVSAEQVDVVVANAENAAGGFGITPMIAEELLSRNIAVLTSGNHIWDKRESYDYLDRQARLLRPANYPPNLPGDGLFVGEAPNGARYAVINLQGRTFMPNTDCPFRKADELLQRLDPDVKIKLVDFHAEVTSEKRALGWYLNGRVTAVLGTHTHVSTADTTILDGGTAYQTDVGMTGPYESIIGVKVEPVIRRFLTSLPVRMEAAKRDVQLHAVLIDADESNGKATAVKRIALPKPPPA
jgi:metallophosphoesterase (TIGR00282 family)